MTRIKPTDAEDAAKVRELIASGDLRPASLDIRQIVDTIKDKLLKPLGLNAPNVPVYVINPALLPFKVSATTKFTHDQSDHERRPTLIGLNGITVVAYPRVDLAATLAHELLHASLPYDADPVTGDFAGHGPVFQHYATAMGLVGDPRSTDPGPQFAEWFKRNDPATNRPMTATEVREHQQGRFPWL